ncbi:basic leucine zipper 34-like [Fagus crenata]
MLNQKKSFSSSCIHMENLMQQSQPTTLGLGHRRSASDSSLALQQHAINIQMCSGESFSAEVSDPFTKKSLFPLDENASSEDELPLVLNDLTRTEPQSAYQHKWSREIDPSINPKKMKRMIANRESAQRSRLRKLEYIEKLKRDIENEQARISLMSPQVKSYELRRMVLQNENNKMKERMETLEMEQAYKEVEFQLLKQELDELSLDLANMLNQKDE